MCAGCPGPRAELRPSTCTDPHVCADLSLVALGLWISSRAAEPKHQKSGTDMTGRPGYRTMEMIGGSSSSYLACTLCVLLFCTLFNRGGNRRVFRLPGDRENIHLHKKWVSVHQKKCARARFLHTFGPFLWNSQSPTVFAD